MREPDLLDLIEAIAEAENGPDPRKLWVHSVMPSMRYVCGGDMVRGLPDGGPPGKWRLGGWGRVATWEEITCPGCRAPGRGRVALAAHRQQKPLGHVCDGCQYMAEPEPASVPILGDTLSGSSTC